MGYFGEDEALSQQNEDTEAKRAVFLEDAIPNAIEVLNEFALKTPTRIPHLFSPIRMIMVLERDYFGRPKVNWRPPSDLEIPKTEVLEISLTKWGSRSTNRRELNKLLHMEREWFERSRYRFAKPRDAHMMSNGGVKVYLGKDGVYYFYHVLNVEYSSSDFDPCYVYRGAIEAVDLAKSIAEDYANCYCSTKQLKADRFIKELVGMLKTYLAKSA